VYTEQIGDDDENNIAVATAGSINSASQTNQSEWKALTIIY